MKTGKRHAAKLKTSLRLQRVLIVLQDRDLYHNYELYWHSTRDILDYSHCCAVGTAIQELRANGIEIETRCKGPGRWEYRLINDDYFNVLTQMGQQSKWLIRSTSGQG